MGETPVKETPAQRAERIKREKNPWEMLPDLLRYAREGFDSIPEEDLNVRFRWWGLYTQGDGKGAFGGAVPYFMLRIRISNGFLVSHQLRTIADLTERYARGFGDITVRQNFQLHWIRIEDVPDIFFHLSRVDITTMGACGDDTRNIVGCPLAGVDAEEICDASPIVFQATRMLVGNPEFYNLPRKYKIGVTGCRLWCSYPEINDIGMTATGRPSNGEREIGFNVRVGGGLSTHPHLGVRLPAFVRWSQAVAVIKGITELYRDSQVLRESREKARLKFLFLNHGWTAESFLEELERRLGFALDPAIPEEPPENVYRDHVGIRPQKQGGYCYAGFAILRGRISADQMRLVASLADRYGDGSIRTTNMQNILILNVPNNRVDDLAREVHQHTDLRLEGTPFWRGTIACTGLEFCKLAISETKGFARWVVEELEDRLPEFDGNLKLHITGCPNDCGQHWIADIGLQGSRMKIDGQMVDAYDVYLGGGVGTQQTIARRVNCRVAATQVPETLERILRAYLRLRNEGESLHRFFQRYSDEELRSYLLGQTGQAGGGGARDADGRPR
ncbi:MAG: nitrite/sulfite reductase [Armatimonadota bacterium]